MTLIGMLEKNSEKFSEKTAIFYHDIKISYRELNETVNRLAHALIELGLKEGDRVGLMLPRIPELVIGFLGIAKAHGIAAPLNFELLDEKIKAIITDISPKYIIVHKQFIEIAKRSIPVDAKIPLIAVGCESQECDLSWEEIIKGRTAKNPGMKIEEHDIVYLNFTSGSTGDSKGAVTTHSHIYWNTVASVDALQLTPDDVHLCMFAPFAHPHEIFARPIYLGGTMVLVDKIHPKSIAENISKHKVTCMMGLAPMYENLLDLIEYKNYDLNSLRVTESGGMHTRIELLDRFRQKIGIPIVPVWGSTETTGIALANKPYAVVPGSIGKPCMSYEVKIVDEWDKEVGVGEIGEMIFRGPAVVQSYYEDALNQETFREGWYYSGDLGRKDEEGNFYFVDRKTGMMKVAGLKVYPMEIELVLLGHPDIKEVAVVSSKDRLRGEVPKAIIVAKNGKGLTEKELIDFCRKRMANYKAPRIVEFRESLPKIGSGKINKKELQSLMSY